MNDSKTKIGIIGIGYVGSAVKKWFERDRERFDVFLYDKFKNLGSPEEINKAKIIFISVPTPFDQTKGGYDDSAIVESLNNIKDGKVVVIRSTILPGSTDKFQEQYPKKTILFNPEFLRAKTATEDYQKPDRQIIGYASDAGKTAAKKVLELLPPAPYQKTIKAKEAELLKYASNAYLATKVIFANQIYDLCQKLGDVDYNVVKEALVQDKRIGNSHLDVLHGDHRGYGGACLPKDAKALIQYAEKLGAPLELLKKVDELNENLQQTNEA